MRRCISLNKGEHRYVFVYHTGQERQLLAAFVELADDAEADFNWLDAAVLSYQLDLRMQDDPTADSACAESRLG